MTTLLTGACGFVGSHYLNTINPYSEPVVCIDINTSGLPENVKLPIEYKNVDLTNKNQVYDLIEEVRPTSIIHLAARSMVGDDDAIKINVSMANNLFHAVADIYKDMTPPRMILAGSAAEYGDLRSDELPADEQARLNPLEPYAESKVIISRVAHAYRRDFHIPITILRFANIYGPRQEKGKLVPNLVAAAVNGEPIKLNGQGTPTRQWLYVDDAVVAIDTALNHINSHPSGVYNIGDQQEVSLHDLARMIMMTVQEQMLRRGEMFKPIAIERTNHPGGSQRVAMDINLAKRVLAFTPRISLPLGITRTVAAYLSDREHEIREATDSGCTLVNASDF